MTRLHEELIQQVRSSVNILDIVSEYVSLKKSGRAMVGLCPFHSEKTPSFNVNQDKQFFKCFGCGKGGDVFTFLMEIEQISFPEALQKLAERAGIAMPHAEHEEISLPDPRQRMYEAYLFVTKLYQHVLTATPYGRQAMEYLRKRGISEQTIEEFQLGYAPDSWNFVTDKLHSRGFDLSMAVDAGILAENEAGKVFDRFRNRIMFPIHDTQGRIIGFGGRSLDGSHPKYLNTPETPLFQKSKTLYNLHRARQAMKKRDQVIVFEGYMDVISAWQAGFHQSIATLGTAFTEHHAKLIRRNTQQVILCYDGDNAGQEATERAVGPLQQAGCNVKIAPLPQGIDPDDFLRKKGAEAFSQQVLLQAVPVTTFRIQQLRSRFRLHDEADQASFIQEALRIIAQLDSAVERDLHERALAEEFNLSPEAVKLEARRIYKQEKSNRQRDKLNRDWNNTSNNGKFTLPKGLPSAYENAERHLLYHMMHNQEIAERVEKECHAPFHIDLHSALAAYLFAYYAEGYPADVARFIHYVEDEKCKQLASGLAMMECSEDVSDQVIGDYIRLVNNYPKRAELDRLREEQRLLQLQAVSAEDEEQRKQIVIQAAILGMKIHELENALKEG